MGMMPGMGGLGMQPQIVLLREGTDTSQGKPQLISNINACQAVVDVVRTTLGEQRERPARQARTRLAHYSQRQNKQCAQHRWAQSAGAAAQHADTTALPSPGLHRLPPSQARAGWTS